MKQLKNFLNSLAALRDSTKYALDFLNNQDFTETDVSSGNSSKRESLDCSEAFDVLKTLKRDVRTFTNTNFVSNEEDSDDEFKDCETANLDNLHSQLSMIVDSFNSEIDVLDADGNESKEPKLDIVQSHQEQLKSMEIPLSQSNENIANKEGEAIENNQEKNETKVNEDEDKEKKQEKQEEEKEKEKEEKEEVKNENTDLNGNEKNNTNNKNNDIKMIIDNENDEDDEDEDKKRDIAMNNRKKSTVAKNFLLSNTMPQTPEIEKIISYVTDVDLNKLNNVEIIKLILDSLIQTCNDLLQFRSDALSDVLSSYPKSPLSETENPKSPENQNNSDTTNETENKDKIATTGDEPLLKKEEIENMNMNMTDKTKTPKELLKELECLIILIHSLYENDPNKPGSSKDQDVESGRSSLETARKNVNESMNSLLTSNTELNSVLNAIESLLNSSPRFNNQCVQINAESKKKFQLMGVISVVDRMTRTRLNDQRATPNQLDHINKLIDLLNKSLVRQYVEQRFTLSPSKEKTIELGRLSYLLERSKSSRLSNQDWCSQNIIREKEIEDMFEQSKYETLENQRFIVGPEKEKNMYFNALLKRVDKLDSYRLSNQDAVIKRVKPMNDSLCSINSNESESNGETSPRRREGPIKRLRRFSKSIIS